MRVMVVNTRPKAGVSFENYKGEGPNDTEAAGYCFDEGSTGMDGSEKV